VSSTGQLTFRKFSTRLRDPAVFFTRVVHRLLWVRRSAPLVEIPAMFVVTLGQT